MPRRQFGQSENFPGVLVVGTTTVNGYTIPIDLNITGRATGDAAEYVASNSVEFGGEFESSVADEFSAYIADGSYAGTGNQVTGGGAYGTAGRYRYGFNGKENDNEVKGVGNAVDFGSRIYDSRIGRWLSTDPLQSKYPSLTPYHFTGNNPINYIDIDGQDTISIHKTFTSYSLGGKTIISGGAFSYSVKKAKGEDIFYYNVITRSISSHGASSLKVKTTQFYPNSAGAQLFTGGSGITQSPSNNIPFKMDNDLDNIVLAKIAPDGLIDYLQAKNPQIYGGIRLDRAGANITEASQEAAGGMLLIHEGIVGIQGLSTQKGATLILPKSMSAELGTYNEAAKNGDLIKVSTKGMRSNAKKVWEAVNGPVPDGYDVDHIIQLQFGGTDDLGNLQLKPRSLNRSEGPKAYHLNKQKPLGTKFTNVVLGEH